MNQTETKREFSMKYCGGLDDYVVVMKTERQGVQNARCLSSHLCPADESLRCGQSQIFRGIHEQNDIKM